MFSFLLKLFGPWGPMGPMGPDGGPIRPKGGRAGGRASGRAGGRRAAGGGRAGGGGRRAGGDDFGIKLSPPMLRDRCQRERGICSRNVLDTRLF